MLRLFTGISLPEDLCQKLQLLKSEIAGARWDSPENYHMTLSFIGPVDEATAEDIDEVLAGICADTFTLTLKGVGVFTRGAEPQHLWIGVEHNEELHRLREKIDGAFQMNHLSFETRQYTPHVTIARLQQADKTKVAAFIQQHNLFVSAPFAVEEFILYQSHHGKELAVYEALEVYPLGLL